MKTKTWLVGGGAVVLLAVAVILMSSGGAQATLTGQATLYKDASCGCCGGYAAYLDRAGVDVETINAPDMRAIKAQHQVPANMQSCHTTLIDEYVVEGHVPPEAMERLLDERPDIRGIAVPGMPTGVPGMPGPRSEIVVYALNNDGSVSEWMRT